MPQLPAIGSVVASQEIDVSSQQSGQVVSIRFDSGQDIAADTLLIEIDSSLDKAQLQSGEATLKDKQRELDRYAALLKRGNTSQSSYDAAVEARDVAAADVAQSKTVIDQKNVKAAFGGRLGIRQIDIGDYLSAGATIVTLQNLDPVYVDFDVPERYIGRLKPGQPVSVRVDAFADTTFVGTVETLDARVDSATRNVKVRAEVSNPDKLLLPGMFADVSVSTGEAQAVVTVPRTAITYSLQGDSVYVVVKDDGKSKTAMPADSTAKGTAPALTLDQRFVRLGEAREDRVAVLDGVKVGEQVVTQGQVKLRKGMAVTVKTDTALKPTTPRPRD
ncbi:MAG: efflux RND transporter periplasmic adaptor subunit [Alphaproteobacteria bacterium]